ncbi:Phosphomevalonate kinase [Rhodotorula sp. JG-1b]|nr:Phosphomevalonate kinase [Rhodotorula sp. JG-1b]
MTTVASCPGKVLLAGGYLVLDRKHQGFVVSTPSRFYTVIRNAPTSAQSAGEEGGRTSFAIKVVSPQFEDGRWDFVATRDDQRQWTVEPVQGERSSSNPFVHLSLQATLQLASATGAGIKCEPLDIIIVGSNDFYTQSRSEKTPEPFAPLHCAIRNIHKTGLGSSAAMVTSLTSSLFLHYTTTPPTASPSPSSSSAAAAAAAEADPSSSSARLSNPDRQTTELLHNLAQYVHSLAQGKIGSGFDVSAAVHGSQTYRRFAVECLGDLLERGTAPVPAEELLSILSPTRNPAWTDFSTAGSVIPFALPPHTLLLLADVDAGSNTPSMVGKVMQWKKAQPEEAERVWNELARANEGLRDVCGELSEAAKRDGEGYAAEVARLAGLPAREWTNSALPFTAAVDSILQTRALMREMGAASDVPIEPAEQSRLLDACSALPGVIGAGVPGAGGYDAIWVLCLDPPSPSPSSSSSTDSARPAAAIESLLRSYTEMSVGPLAKSAWVRGGTFEGEAGLLRERVERVPGLVAAVERAKRY